MPLAQNLQLAKDFLTGLVPYTFGEDTKPLSEWYTLGADNACIAAMNDPALGTAQGKTVLRALIDGNKVVNAIVASDEFATMQPATCAQLQFAVSRGPLAATPELVSGIARILAPFTGAPEAFQALTTRPSTVWESIAKEDGASFTQTEMSAVRAG